MRYDVASTTIVPDYNCARGNVNRSPNGGRLCRRPLVQNTVYVDREDASISHSCHHRGVWTYGSPEGEVEFLGAYFELQFVPNPPVDWDFDEQVERNVTDFLSLPDNSDTEPISRAEISDRLVELRQMKALGPDGDSNIAFQHPLNNEFFFWSRYSSRASD